MKFENAIVVVNKTRLEALVERFNTKAQARFYIEHSGGDFGDYEDEHETFHRALNEVVRSLQRAFKPKVIERKFVPSYLFRETDLVVVVGQDGLVANTAKYANGLPILAINPDPGRYDGVLLPFNMENFEVGWHTLLNETATYKKVTLAEARTNDGQRLLAFNDFFIGPASHTSARYKITHGDDVEQQSSSGIIVSTGAGSTGWLSSVFNMANGVADTFGDSLKKSQIKFALSWESEWLTFVVREPFQSKHSSIRFTSGTIEPAEKFIVESFMPSNGVVFSDGIEADFIHFNSGVKVEIGVAAQKACLISSR